MTPEELEALDKSIPDWKKGALVVTEEQAAEEKAGLLRRLGRKVKSSVAKTDSFKEF